jgi:hypothetical protein
VIGDDNEIVGSLHASHVINMLFGGKSGADKSDA